jgi:two-component system, cell cycle sensor histidine kinase and response regulator CckA
VNEASFRQNLCAPRKEEMSREEITPDYVTVYEHESASVLAAIATGRRIARFSILLGPNAGRTYAFGDECTIGRSSDATVSVPDRGVSRLHVRVRRLPEDRFILEDLSSRNGTLVNGERVASVEIQSGARIQVGPRCLLLFSVHDDFEESLAQARTMEIIGRLSAGINHDFNNLLCVVLANAAYLLELPRKTTLNHVEVRECLEDMRSAAQAGAGLTGKLATLVQGGPALHETIDLSKLCEEVVGVLRDTFPRTVRVEPRIQPGIFVRGIRAPLWQLLLNPCVNARDAMPDGGTLGLDIVLKSARELEVRPPVHAECYAVITVTDTGHGMKPEVLKAAFEPFFTTKEIDLGRGLGLATVRKVASEHGGTVELSSRPGAGTILRIVLPLAQSLAGESEPAGTRPQSKSGELGGALEERAGDDGAQAAPAETRPRVLIAEDDPALARAFGRALRRAGYEVLWVESAAQAVATFAQHGASLHAVLLDLDMPDAAIHEAYAMIRARCPELPVVALAAAQPGADQPADASNADESVLRKPVDPGVLARVLSAAVRGHGRPGGT